MDVQELKEKKVSQLLAIANSMEIEGASSMRKQELIFAILQAHQHSEKEQPIRGEGVLETLPDGFGFLRAPNYNALA